MKDSLVLLSLISTLTGLLTEGIKNTFPQRKIKNNLLAAIVSICTAIIVCIGYILINKVTVTPNTFVNVFAITVLSWLCATLGYDKVIQTINQLSLIKK